ncbi:aldo/keto reductase [Reticulibacter mediterranei]|uniref:aldo/keto reductase n=1 Tax=Reticulibacter mediterranei TaxID=2778369 RepID=UPI001C6887B5|nr:aldo/keto reductase [Reticulibacter mediterranei]
MSQSKSTRISLGQEKLSGSCVGIGTWAIGGGWGSQSDEDSLKAIHAALDLGCQLIDTAPLYGNGHAERLIARVFKERGSRVTTCTKVYPLDYQWAPAPGTPLQDIYPPEHILAQAEGSLQRLGIDCLDCLLFQTWCPSWSEERSWSETMLHLRQQGKIRTFGISVSDHRPEEVIGIIEAGLVDIVEVPYSILDQRAAARLFPVAQQHHVSIIARTPLASGSLAGDWYNGMKFPRDDWRRRVFRNDLLQQTLQRVAKIRSLVDPSFPLAQIALRFCLSHPAVTAVIPGVRNVDQVHCNLAVLEQDPLPHTLLEQIDSLWHEEFHENVRTSVGEEGEGEKRLASHV